MGWARYRDKLHANETILEGQGVDLHLYRRLWIPFTSQRVFQKE